MRDERNAVIITTLHRRREYRPPAALGDAAKNNSQHVGDD